MTAVAWLLTILVVAPFVAVWVVLHAAERSERRNTHRHEGSTMRDNHPSLHVIESDGAA